MTDYKKTFYVLTGIIDELEKAKEKHKVFYDDIIHMVSVMTEESGESIRAALQYVYEDGNIKDVIIELRQTAAMCIRILEIIDS